MNLARKIWRRGRSLLLPTTGFSFDRPLVLFQSDDWGRVGLRDREGLEQLRGAGISLQRPYDYYTLETAGDLDALRATLRKHRDSTGRSPCVVMNFILANLDFARMSAEGFERTHLLSLAEGLPQPWNRPGLAEAYKEGIKDGVFYPALHGLTHFCGAAMERNLSTNRERGDLLRTFWRAGTPYIHWRMPWIGYEYWDPEKSEEERFLRADEQRELVGQAVGAFAKMFVTLPRTACAPAYRADAATNQAWIQHGIRVTQGGPALVPPHFEQEVLQVSRTIEFEPALNQGLQVEDCLRQAEACFAKGLPAIVCVHSINFHSTVRDFRSHTLKMLDEFLTALESRYSDLLYLHDENLLEIVDSGSYRSPIGAVPVNVRKKKFNKLKAVQGESADVA